MISQETVASVKNRVNLVEVVQEFVQLKRRGSGYTGLCPFHTEKSPSFTVRDGGEFFHCFGCGASGDGVSFFMKIRGLNFPEAIEELAGRYGIEVKREGKADVGNDFKTKNLFWKVNAAAQKYFKTSLENAEPRVSSYIIERKLTKEAIEKFGIGFAPEGWSGLTTQLRSLKANDDLIVESGLARRNPRGELYDGFRGRIIFPVFIDAKRIAGFGGRVIPSLVDKETLNTIPKYLNSPETPIYQKKKILYGLPQALPSIRKNGEVYLVEGYMDVVGLAQQGVENVVATCGTALTEEHVSRLKNVAKRIVVLFDGDSAGREAAAKSFLLFLNAGLDVVALFLPQGEDPDTIALAHKEKTAEYLNSLPKVSLLECFIGSLFRKYGSDGAREIGAASKGAISEEIIRVLKNVENPVEKDALIHEAARKLLVDPAELAKVKTQGKEISKEKLLRSEAQNSLEAALTPGRAVDIATLPALDKELLLVAMAHKESIPAQVLADPEIATGLNPATIQFIEGLSSIMIEDGVSDEERKMRILGLLKEFGGSWVSHWKKAYKMLQDPFSNLLLGFDQCKQAIKKYKLIQAVTEKDSQILEAASDEEKVILIGEKISLRQRLDVFKDKATSV